MGFCVGIDGTVITPTPKGAGRVVTELASAFPRVGPEHRYVVFAGRHAVPAVDPGPNVSWREIPAMAGVRWELWASGRAARAANVDVLLTLREFVGFGHVPVVLHLAETPSYRLGDGADGRPIKHRAKDRLLHGMLPILLRRAAYVTAASPSTATTLFDRHGVAAPVIRPGVPSVFLGPASPRRGGRYLLHSATGDPRENTRLVLEAVRASTSRDVRLVLVGTPEDRRSSLVRIVDAFGLAERVDITGWVSDEELRDLYAGAVGMIHPSRYEGFVGLQVLEAMAQGTPVVCLAGPGVEAELGGAGILLEREDPSELSRAIDRLLEDEDWRRRMGAQGRGFARSLTWDAAAAAFNDVFDRVLED